MSDLEDEAVILDDIKALQAVLTRKSSLVPKKEVSNVEPISTNHSQCQPSTSQGSDTCQPISQCLQLDSEDSDNGYDDGDDEPDLSDPKAALNLNKKIINLLTMAQKRLQLLLTECKRRQAVIDQKISESSSSPSSRTYLMIAGMPYFKDKQQFPSPKNEDAKIKASRQELQMIDLPFPLRWTLKDRNVLWEAIYWNAKIICREETKRSETGNQLRWPGHVEDPLRLETKFRNKKIPEEILQHFKRLVGPLGSKEFDWMKIAATDFNGRHSASECRAMWHVFLHPDINKGKWKKSEDSDLKTLAEEHKFQNWDVIASSLNTNRTGYQCFIRFNTNFRNKMFGKGSSWTKEEDQKLTDAVNTLRTGNFIPWGDVAKLMGKRRKQQIYMRWNYSLLPNLKKGRFTEEENKLLIQGVSHFGLNFTKISVALLPHRTTAQLNDHYKTLMNEKKNEWSSEDDVKLVRLYDNFGNNWSRIANEFPNKSRVQVRHRYSAIIRYLDRGHSITSIPRWGQKTEDSTPEELLAQGKQKLEEMSSMIRGQLNKKATREEDMPAIDAELRDYFKGMYPTNSKPGRVKKFYSVEELHDKTQKLYVILRILNANLDIPDDLEEVPHLTEKDKQLLTSLKEYSQSENIESDIQAKLIECTRNQMFGPPAPIANKDRFVPPIPFDGKSIKSKTIQPIGIDYDCNGDKCLVRLPEEFEPCGVIISLIGGYEQEIEFQKAEKLFINKSKISPEVTLRIRQSLQRVRLPSAPISFSSPNIWNENLTASPIDLHGPSTSRIAPIERNIDQQMAPSTNLAFSQNIPRTLTRYYPELLIPPNHSTLLGFRGILLAKHILEADLGDDGLESEENTIMPEGQKALELFEERLAKLFKFPIELSEISPPLVHDLVGRDFSDIDNDNCGKKRKRGKAGLPAKRKPKTEKDVHEA